MEADDKKVFHVNRENGCESEHRNGRERGVLLVVVVVLRKCDGKRACLLLVFCLFFMIIDISATLVRTLWTEA